MVPTCTLIRVTTGLHTRRGISPNLSVDSPSLSAEHLSGVASTSEIVTATCAGFTYRLVDIIDLDAEAWFVVARRQAEFGAHRNQLFGS